MRSVNVKLPLTPQMQPRDAVVEGKVRVSDGKVRTSWLPRRAGRQHGRRHEPDCRRGQGGVPAQGRAGEGELAARVWCTGRKQPPLRVTATLDNNERTQLGLDINDIVQGEVGVE